jgi:hypothetical protein
LCYLTNAGVFCARLQGASVLCWEKSRNHFTITRILQNLENLDHENENEEIDHNSSVYVPNVSNIENLGDDYEKKIPHFDIYDPRN